MEFINSHLIDTLQGTVRRDEIKCLTSIQLEIPMVSAK